MARHKILMSRTALLATVLANVLLSLVGFPTESKAVDPGSSPVPQPNNSANAPSPATVTSRTKPTPPPVTAGFVFERQLLSPSGNVRIRYSRDRKANLRRITLEDAQHPQTNEVLCEYKHSAWIVLSPNDEWLALDERGDDKTGSVKLYHRVGSSGVHYEPVEGSSKGPSELEESVWHSYLSATQNDPKTPLQGVTIDATTWDNDSHKLGLAVAFIRSAGDTDVPEPWSCTYDVATKVVTPDTPVAAADDDNASPNATPVAASKDTANPNAASQEESTSQQSENSAEPNESDNQYPGEKFPATREEALTVPDVNQSSLSDINYAINEMYARHGAEFRDAKLTKEFSQFAWYQPRPGVTHEQIEGEFSDLEKQNLKVLERCRGAKMAAARRPHVIRGQRVYESPGDQILRNVFGY